MKFFKTAPRTHLGWACLVCLSFLGNLSGLANWVTASIEDTPPPREVPAQPVARAVANPLERAAIAIEKGDDVQACELLSRFLHANPEHRTAAYYHAELLLKLHRHAEARDAFEHAIANYQAAQDVKQQLQCHGRLVHLAETMDDAYLEHLHRGIAMILLAKDRAARPDPTGDLPAEALLWKATAELMRAHQARPRESRPAFYLHLAWQRMAQSGPTRRWLTEAQHRADFTYLTPSEQERLQLALAGVR